MKMVSITVLFLGCFVGSAQSDSVNPIQKVLQMISDLQAKVIGEGEEAQKAYDEFSEWCEDRSKALSFEIKTGKDEVQDLKATIDDETQKIEAFNTKIDQLSDSIATDEADLKAAREIRAKENADFKANEKELTTTIDMIERAMLILEKEMSKSGASMLQMKDADSLARAFSTLIQAAGFNSADASKLTALVQSSDSSDDDGAGAPAAAVYKGHSGNIIDTLNSLLEKAQGQLDEARKGETNSQNNFDLLQQSLEDSIRVANQDLDGAKKGMAASSERKATATGDLDVTTKDLNADVAALKELHHDCMTKAEDFEAETKSRDEELAALAKAKQIISDTTSGAAGQSYSFLQTNAFAALSNMEVVRFVRDLAQKQHAPALAQLASRIGSIVRLGNGNADVFGKVKGLIADMIEKLENEAAEDATHKAYCDKELSETKEKQAAKNNEINKLSTKIDAMSSRSAKLKEEVATLQNELSELAKSQAAMDQLRGQEKGDFGKNSAEMEKGLKGIKLALKVLRDYYSKSDDASHGVAEGAGASIIGLLEVCESDFTKGLAEMRMTEENAQAEYDRLSKENEIEKTTKEQDVKYKNKEATQLDKDTVEAKSDRSGVQDELDAVEEYLHKLNGECIEEAETYEERTSRRDAEIAGLKEALNILENETAFLQKSSRRVLRRAFLHSGH